MKLSFPRKKAPVIDDPFDRRVPDVEVPVDAPKRRLADALPDTRSTSPGVLQFNGKAYAVGLLWFTVQEDSSKKLLGKRIEKTRADFTCLRTHISQQQGFGWLEKGHRRGMPAAAAMIADQLVGEWHGVFEADNGWWYVQVRSDTITPNGDRFFESEEEAFNTFSDEALKNVWPHAYAPDKWQLGQANTRELPLRNMLDDLATTTLSPANFTAAFGGEKSRNVVLAGVAVLFALMGVALLYTMVFPSDVAPVAAVRTPAQIAATQRILMLNAPKPKTSEAVSPRQLLQQCGTAAAQLFVSIPGWTPASFACAMGKAGMGWVQKTGALGDAKAIGLKYWPPEVAISYNARKLKANLPLGNLPKVEAAKLPDQEEALLYLEQYLQPLGALQVKPVVPPAPKVAVQSRSFLSDAPAPAPPPPPLPSYLDIMISSGFGPDKLADLLEQPGLELTQIDWNIDNGVWQYKVKWTYANAPVTAPPPKPAAAAIGAAAVSPAPANAASLPQITGKLVGETKQLHAVDKLPDAPPAVPVSAASPASEGGL